jgi:hypothetical protein
MPPSTLGRPRAATGFLVASKTRFVRTDYRPRVERRLPASVSRFRDDCRPKCADQATGDHDMARVDVLRNKAEEYLEKARAISDRQRARLVLLQAHNYLKRAEETEARQLSARR